LKVKSNYHDFLNIWMARRPN